MRKAIVTAVLSGIAIGLVGAEPAAAQAERHLIRIGFGGGVSVPTSDVRSALDNGVNGQAYLLFDPGLGFPLRFNLGYQKFDFKEAVLNAVTGEQKILSGVGGITFNLFQIGPIRPYVTAGLGAFQMSTDYTTGTVTTEESDLRFGIDGGGGLALKIGRLEAFIEGRVQNVYTETGVIETKTIRHVPVTFGIMF
jgi:hypothetical protein